MNTGLVSKAKEFATSAHAGQTEKDEQKTPYIYHPQKVAQLVEESGGTPEEIAAAWLHDVVEDTGVSIVIIEKEFGSQVAHIVEGLTDLAGWENLPTEERKQKQADRVLEESDEVKRVKLADQISTIQLDGMNNLLTKNHRITYAEGCRKIAENCKGISKFLDDTFEKVYKNVVQFLDNS